MSYTYVVSQFNAFDNTITVLVGENLDITSLGGYGVYKDYGKGYDDGNGSDTIPGCKFILAGDHIYRCSGTPTDVGTYKLRIRTATQDYGTLTVIVTVKYMVSYDANGGTPSPPGGYVYYDSSTTLPTVTREGYTFAGWYTEQSGGTKVGDAGASYTPTSNITLFAQWTLIKYSLTLIHYSGITESISVQSGTLYTLPTGRTDWTNSQHYSSSGWYSGTTLIGKSGAQITIDRDLTLTMLWTPINYTVTFVSAETSENVKLVGSIEKSVTAPTPKNQNYYAFAGWTDGTQTIQSGASFVPTSDITFTAIWTGIKYTLTFVHSTGNTTTIGPIQGGTSVTLPTAKTDWADSEYYTEQGWYTSANPLKYLKSGSAYTVTKNETLTMSWVGKKYTVSFVSGGGTVPSSIGYTYSDGVEITLPNAITDYTYHTFSAWETDGAVYTAGSKYKPKGDVVFSAKWSLEKYTVTYKSSTAGVTVPKSVTVVALTEITLGTPTRTHYDPTGWYTSETGGTKVGVVGGKYTVRSNITLYPQWTPTNYTVSFSVPSGVGSVADMVGTAFSYIALPNITGTIANKTFQGWSENADGSGTVYKVNYAYYPTGNRTLYAVFSDNYIVRLYRNYSASDSTTVQTFSVSQGKSVKLSNYPTPDYYYCTGWYDARSNGKLVGLQGANYTPTKSIDLYAHWQNCPVVTFDANGGIVEGAETLSVKTTGQSTFQIKSEDYPAVPTRNFHTFLGWYTITNERYDKDSVYTKSITLQARWSEVRITEIRLSVNGQTGEVILPEAGIVSTAKATIITSSSGESPDLSKIAWSSNNESLSVIVGADRTTAQIIPLDVSGNVTVLLTASISYDDAIVSGSIKLNLSQKIYLTLINDYAERDSERTVTIPIDDVTHLPTTFPSVPTRKGYEFNAWLDTSTDALITSDTPILYNRRARARWFKAYDQWDKDNLIIQLYNAEGTAIVKQFAMGSVQSISTSYKISPTSIPTPMQTSESTFLIDTAVTMTLDVECTRVNPTLKDGESYDDDGEDYNYWTNRKWVNEMMSLVDRWQGQSDGVKVLYIPNDCDVYDLAEGEKAFGEYYPLIGSTSKDYKSGFLYKGRFYQGKNAYITSLIRSIDQTTPELTQVNIGFAIGGLKSRYV